MLVSAIVASMTLWQGLALVLLTAGLLVGGFLLYIWYLYVPEVSGRFLKAPPFQPLQTAPDPSGEEVRFETHDGLQLAGTYYSTCNDLRKGVVVFCHEFLADRHTAHQYVGYLRAEGFDLFTFDFRNHGDSQSEPGLKPIHWVTDRELTDLRAALRYVRSRPDFDLAGLGLFGVSRGGGAALFLTAEEPGIWAVGTDGAFPTRSTMLNYVHKWAEIVVRHWWIHWMPNWIFRFAAATGRIKASRKLGRKFPRLERAVTKISPRPWLAIHGADDSYVPPQVVKDLVRQAGKKAPISLWLVPDAKHNRCREVAPDEYRQRVTNFFVAAAPRGGTPGSDEVRLRSSETELAARHAFEASNRAKRASLGVDA
jgi:fermentation-respiration switch protein FrsA (DUF1100 family)